MTTPTDGQICFGILFDGDTEFPWDDRERWDDIDDWWLSYVLKWMPSNELYDKDDEYIGGVRPPEEKIDQYYQEKREFKEKAPKLPVQLVNVCSGEYPEYILAVPSTFTRVNRGYPKSFDPDELYATRGEVEALLGFCRKYNIESGDGPKWYLSSYWG